ncbi:MAG: hypothetical protein BWY24_00769 [Microgenomates group bacterium ADurb.Bin219]|nr:MAG: hypothetical protein BWY24_00769 [Microgenomates group bacterium ADurb.Bin219]HNP89231.1 DUF5680 domain-containing protein [Candidatus Woesebacteria bacterium]
MDLTSFKKFLIDSNKVGYAGGEEKKWIKEADGSTTIPFEKGEWKSHDNFFGGEPYGGRTIVFYRGEPYWLMVYYGRVEDKVETDSVYGILRNALKQMPEDYPFRGPKEYKEKEFIYKNNWQGEVDKFSGEELIFQNGKPVYKANYVGGLVDQKKGI